MRRESRLFEANDIATITARYTEPLIQDLVRSACELTPKITPLPSASKVNTYSIRSLIFDGKNKTTVAKTRLVRERTICEGRIINIM